MLKAMVSNGPTPFSCCQLRVTRCVSSVGKVLFPTWNAQTAPQRATRYPNSLQFRCIKVELEFFFASDGDNVNSLAQVF